MRTVITHFYNEEYLLPWWLKHHLQLFDHGILINHGSTDGSVDICRFLAPNWQLVNSTLSNFDAVMTDFEVMKYEEYIPGFKIALTTTEFLMPTKPMSEIDERLLRERKDSCAFTGVIMVDVAPDLKPIVSAPLPWQKHHGYIEMNVTRGEVFYNRIYHNSSTGQYKPGRHHSYLKDSAEISNEAYIFKYKYSPWTPAFIKRKLQIGARIGQKDRDREFGNQHLKVESELHSDYQSELRYATNLVDDKVILSSISAAFVRWRSSRFD